jgi:putative Mg2+ transporter-C (MgtC) family protein
MPLHLELLLRIVVATALGGVIGLERQVHRRPAGLRTHMLVALASATFMVVSTHFVYFQHYRRDDLVTVDTSRIAASVVAGTGFLAGGAILRTGLNVQGLTTGAGLWLVSSIGLAAGGGMYVESAAATALGLLALSVVRRLERKEDAPVRRRLTVTTVAGASSVAGIHAAVQRQGCGLKELEYERDAAEGRLTVVFEVQIPADVAWEGLLRAVAAEPGVAHVRLASGG